MDNFIIRFLNCNLLLCAVIAILFVVKSLFKNSLTSQMQYNLWFVFLFLLAVPFLPVSFSGRVLSLSGNFSNLPAPNQKYPMEETTAQTFETSNWINDFTLSVTRETSHTGRLFLFVIWILGIFVMLLFAVRSYQRLNDIKESSLPLQSKEIRRLYQQCLEDMQIKRDIPIYSTAFLKSPMIVGLFHPCIYLPIHLISDYDAASMRYMLLHELQHYKHKDALANYLINLAGILYWFHPLIRYALKEMRGDREIACDASVLKMLEETEYEAYGNTLLNFAEKISANPFPFATGMSSNMKQMKKRILNIASYEKPTRWKKAKGLLAFVIVTVLLLNLAPALSTYALETNHYSWDISDKNISYIDVSNYFGDYEGSFVLYDLKKDSWSIYNIENATVQVSPDSTYKIYSALFGLEEGVITPDNSSMTWDGKLYPIEAWNKNQNLQSAMTSSVNWYFQSIDQQLGATSVSNYIQKIGYGNEDISGDFATYWMESSLKISPVEQVELLTNFYQNSFGFSQETIDAVRNSLCLSSTKKGCLYGKTGTGRINEQDVNGWFVGFVEQEAHTYFFAVNIQGETEANGSHASQIALSILSHMNLW